MGQLCLGFAARYPLPLSTQQSCVSVVPALVLSLCHLTSIVHSQSAESPQLPNCRISNLSPLLSFCFLNPPCTIIFGLINYYFYMQKKKRLSILCASAKARTFFCGYLRTLASIFVMTCCHSCWTLQRSSCHASDNCVTQGLAHL